MGTQPDTQRSTGATGEQDARADALRLAAKPKKTVGMNGRGVAQPAGAIGMRGAPAASRQPSSGT